MNLNNLKKVLFNFAHKQWKVQKICLGKQSTDHLFETGLIKKHIDIFDFLYDSYTFQYDLILSRLLVNELGKKFTRKIYILS